MGIAYSTIGTVSYSLHSCLYQYPVLTSLWVDFPVTHRPFLPISEPAVILEKTEPITVMAGNPFTLECKVGGTPELITKWYKDGRELKSDRKYQITFFNNISTLKVFSADRGDRGLYTFEVHNEVGDSSCTSSVDVSGQLYVFIVHSCL